MATCPDCGEIVMEGDPYCSNCGATLSWSGDEKTSSHSYHYPTDEELLRYYSKSYRDNLRYARNETDDKKAMKCYNSAIYFAGKYNELSNKLGWGGGAVPDNNHLLEPSDVERCSKIHRDNLGKGSFFNDRKEICDSCEEILNNSGNAIEINRNKRKMEARLKVQREIAAREREKSSIKSAREQYYKYLEKANDAVERDAPKFAIKNYRKAIESHETYFSKDYEKYDASDAKIMPQPPERLTDEARYYLLELYKNTHPLISASKKSSEVNSEIVSILVELHKDDLEKADIEVKEIIHQKELKRQRQKQQVEDVIVDGIVNTRILGEKILGKFKK